MDKLLSLLNSVDTHTHTHTHTHTLNLFYILGFLSRKCQSWKKGIFISLQGQFDSFKSIFFIISCTSVCSVWPHLFAGIRNSVQHSGRILLLPRVQPKTVLRRTPCLAALHFNLPRVRVGTGKANPQISMTTGEDVITCCQKFLYRSCRCCRPDKFAVCVCVCVFFGGWVWIAFMCVVFRTNPQMIVTNARLCERAGHEDDKLFAVAYPGILFGDGRRGVNKFS